MSAYIPIRLTDGELGTIRTALDAMAMHNEADDTPDARRESVKQRRLIAKIDAARAALGASR